MKLLLRTLPLALLLLSAPALAQESLHLRAQATERMLSSRGEAALREFAGEHLANGFRDRFESEDALIEYLEELRDAVAPVGGVMLLRAGPRALRIRVVNAERRSTVFLQVQSESPGAIEELEFEGSEEGPEGPEVTWASLEETLLEAEREGFCGSILVVRDGEVVLDRGYGFADPAREHRVTPHTLFAIGSTPIDFTHAAILKLEEMGKLSLSDTLPRWFDDVPADKATITLDHLRTGRSGLQNFHGIQGVDASLDLSWIDRDEAMRRIFAAKLLFEPGEGEAHSHSAWGVLAAVVELASGQTYDDFLRTNFFDPAEMDRTGPYPWSLRFGESEVAVGLGGNVWGEVNSPRSWGETSWLVLGSGGMVSTPRDLLRFREYLRSGEALGKEAQRKYGLGGVFAGEGGNDRGFLNVLAYRGDDALILCSNAHTEPDDPVSLLGMALIDLVLDE